MSIRVATLRGLYLDSVFLMRVADRITHAPGVRRAAAVMGTPANRRSLEAAGLFDASIAAAGPDDLVIVIDAETDEAAEAARERLNEWIAPATSPSLAARSLDDALRILPNANVALISVPGDHAAAEARAALDRGLHAFVFSSGVTVADEVALKRDAHERGLLVMGPDCGTAIVGGLGLGFANAVRRGPIGVVGGAGTGIQELTTLIHRAGSGVSHAIGTGGRDLSDAVGGITTFDALDALAVDPVTKVIVVVSKPPGDATLARLVEHARGLSTPVVLCALGASVPQGTGYARAATLDEAVSHALALTGGPAEIPDPRAPLDRVRAEASRLDPRRRYVRGLFAGGTLAYQAQVVLRDAGLVVRSNAPLDPSLRLDVSERSGGHAVLDLGAEELVRGRPHPMIDPRPRHERIVAEISDPGTAVLLLDVVIGHAAMADPAVELTRAIEDGRRAAGAHVAVVASVTGTDDDPQDRSRQVEILERAGAVVLPTAAQAASFAARTCRAHAPVGAAA